MLCFIDFNGKLLAQGPFTAIIGYSEAHSDPAAGCAFRQLLNLGHTFGHALEAFTGYSDRLLHGEAVAIGMCLAFRLSEEIGACPPQTAARVSAHIKAMGLPTHVQDIPGGDLPSADVLVDLMGQDKKVRDGQLTFILARGIGDAFITREVARDDVRRFLEAQLAA